MNSTERVIVRAPTSINIRSFKFTRGRCVWEIRAQLFCSDDFEASHIFPKGFSRHLGTYFSCQLFYHRVSLFLNLFNRNDLLFDTLILCRRNVTFRELREI